MNNAPFNVENKMDNNSKLLDFRVRMGRTASVEV